jgi:hypothetical protein
MSNGCKTSVMATRNKLSGRVPIAAQIGLVAVLSAALTYVTTNLNYRTGLNALWMIALPIVVGLSLNQGAGRRAIVAVMLVGVSLVFVMTCGWMMGGI